MRLKVNGLDFIASYEGLDWQVQEDLDACVADKAGVHPGQVMEFFKKHPPKVQVIWVDPASLIGPKGRAVDPPKVKEYVETWKKTPKVFPPVIIDSDRPEHAICEGGHRTVAAKRAKVSWIRAIDVAPLVRELRESLATLREETEEYSARQTDEPWWLARYQGRT